MSEVREDKNPVFYLDVNSTTVTLRFCEVETKDLKERVRDILTAAYEERFQQMFCNAPLPGK